MPFRVMSNSRKELQQYAPGNILLTVWDKLSWQIITGFSPQSLLCLIHNGVSLSIPYCFIILQSTAFICFPEWYTRSHYLRIFFLASHLGWGLLESSVLYRAASTPHQIPGSKWQNPVLLPDGSRCMALCRQKQPDGWMGFSLSIWVRDMVELQPKPWAKRKCQPRRWGTATAGT